MNIRTALTGYITPRCKIYDGGFFAKESLDPDNYGSVLAKMRKEFETSERLERKAQIRVLKDKRILEAKQLVNIRYLESRDGRIIIHKRYEVLKNELTNRAIISAVSSKDINYRRSFVDKDGTRKSIDRRAIVARSKPLATRNGHYLIASSKKKEGT